MANARRSSVMGQFPTISFLKATIALTAALFLCAFPSTGFGQNCTLSGTVAWSKQLRDVIRDCDNRFTSPNRELILRIDLQGRMQLSGTAAKVEAQVPLRAVEPPAMMSWSPKSDAFFIDDGEGSGLASVFRLFRVKDGQAVEDRTIEPKAVALFRSLKKCSSAAADPNVYGFGWSPNGTVVYLLIQTTVNDPCGETDSFVAITVKLSDGSVVKQFSQEATKRQFRPLLPRELYSK